MNEENVLTAAFEASRGDLRNVAYRMLGSAAEAEDAVQKVWLKVSQSDASAIQNMRGWMTTIVARVCLDMLRARKSRHEEPLTANAPEPAAPRDSSADPEKEVILAESVGLALLVVLEALSPAERVAFVLHDMFDLAFDEIAPIVERTPEATRQLASRARRRVQGKGSEATAKPDDRKRIVDAFLKASRTGDFEGLLAVLDPNVVVRADATLAKRGEPLEVRGAEAVAKAYLGRARAAQTALVDGEVGAIVAPRGRLLIAVRFQIEGGRIIGIEGIGDPDRLATMEFALAGE